MEISFDEEWVNRIVPLEAGYDIAAGVPGSLREIARIAATDWLVYCNLVMNQAQRAQRVHGIIDVIYMWQPHDKNFSDHVAASRDLDRLCVEASEKYHVCASWCSNEPGTYFTRFVPREE